MRVRKDRGGVGGDRKIEKIEMMTRLNQGQCWKLARPAAKAEDEKEEKEGEQQQEQEQEEKE